MQDLGFVFQEPVVAKAPFNHSSGSKDVHTYLPELVPSRSPLELLRAVANSLNRGPAEPTTRFAGGLTPGGGTGHAHDVKGPLSCDPPGSSPLMVQ